MKHTVLAIIVTLALAATAPGQGTITLRSMVRVNPEKGVVLGDIADLSGRDAQAEQGLVIVADPKTELATAGAAGVRVDLARVRQALEKNSKLNLGRLVMSGGQCIMRAEVAASDSPAPTPAKPCIAAPGVETVRDRVASRIASTLNADITDLKLTYEDQPELLATPAAGRTVAVQVGGVGDRMALGVRVYEADRVVAQGTVRVSVLVHRQVVIAKSALSRGSQVGADALETDAQWLPPTLSPATLEQVSGSVARGRVEAGRVIMDKDVEPPVLVKRGDLISVDCVSGTVVVGTTARAKEQGCDGQVIVVQSLQSKKTFSVRVSGAGRGVLVNGEQ